MTASDAREVGPTPGELAAIEAEWPLISAELALLDAEIIAVHLEGAASPLDRLRVRHAELAVLREAVALERCVYGASPERAALVPGDLSTDNDDMEVA